MAYIAPFGKPFPRRRSSIVETIDSVERLRAGQRLRAERRAPLVTVSATISIVAVAAPAAYALAHLYTRRGSFLLAILIARMVPGAGVVIQFYLVVSKLGQLDTCHVLVTIFTAFNLPFAIWLLRSFFHEIPSELREAAIVEGCSEIGVFARIVVPLAMGGIVASGVFVILAPRRRRWRSWASGPSTARNGTRLAPLRCRFLPR
jgi:ABC-type glycerol-3-phosphate transport system permease component